MRLIRVNVRWISRCDSDALELRCIAKVGHKTDQAAVPSSWQNGGRFRLLVFTILVRERQVGIPETVGNDRKPHIVSLDSTNVEHSTSRIEPESTVLGAPRNIRLDHGEVEAVVVIGSFVGDDGGESRVSSDVHSEVDEMIRLPPDDVGTFRIMAIILGDTDTRSVRMVLHGSRRVSLRVVALQLRERNETGLLSVKEGFSRVGIGRARASHDALYDVALRVMVGGM